MLRFLVFRVLAIFPVMAIVAVVVFLMLRLSPGDPATTVAGDGATPDAVAAVRDQLGLDRPLLPQFVHWVTLVLKGDLGTSILSGKPVISLIAQRIEPTISLAITTMLLAILVAVPLGVLAGSKEGTWIDRGVMVLSIIGFSVPSFVLGYLCIYTFAMGLGWFPVQGFTSISQGIGPFLQHIMMPAMTMGLIYTALIARITRASVIEVLRQDYVRTARAKGVPEWSVIVHHVMRNCAVPVVSIVGIGAALLIGGVVIAELVFNLPGLGRLTVDAVLARDYPVIQAIILIFSGVYVLINLGVDIAYAALDPRIRY